ncbi:MAG: phenylalanine--tRNA ligase subunit alpha [Bacteroidia bacterium]|nr:phenylalanine--tRNA ligase subunit alpha [Bacteroidia bacterium]MCX7652726.1 phenylalanine--tRNA ligase subunit alpha [Bacteroidia bacterium]MDW8416390.1 phenylalanine--tRNA ligase subunit alpha [Bacteroidia bacterium]
MDISALEREIVEADLSSPEAQQRFRQKFLKKGGVLDELFAKLRSLPQEQRKELGTQLNRLRALAQGRVEVAGSVENSPSTALSTDATFPRLTLSSGGRHPLSIVEERVIRLFQRLGYSLADGPEIEDDWHNFTALNFEPDHPARDMQDTFFINPSAGRLLRTHTSTVQVRVMEAMRPPIRILAPGRVYRHETISARAHVYFHQIEGLYIDTHVSAADLRATLEYFIRSFFGEKTRTRWRASYFPFTEMSAEVDIGCLICGGEGCPVCKYSGWVEVLGCGMVDPNVLTACGISPEAYRGFAFGLGVERITQLLFGIPDLRLFGQNNISFLESFRGYGYAL